jgi:hypothetical protein
MACSGRDETTRTADLGPHRDHQMKIYASFTAALNKSAANEAFATRFPAQKRGSAESTFFSSSAH